MTSSPSWRLPTGSRDRWPDDYERGRPGWPSAAVDVAGLPPSATVLDLGAGTGKLTRPLLATFDRVIAVEPAEAMRRILVRTSPRAESVAGSGQQIPLTGSSVDAVYAAQAFHWFDDERAMSEIARVLRPGGALVLMWNLPAAPTEPAIAEAEAVLRPRAPTGDLGYDPLDLGHGPRYASGEWLEELARFPFDPIAQVRLPNPQVVSQEHLVAFYASMGWIAELPDDDRLALLADLRCRLTSDEYLQSWETLVSWTRRHR